MPQLRISPAVEPLILVQQQLTLDTETTIVAALFNARYDYAAKCFSGYVQHSNGTVQRVSLTLVHSQAARAASDWIHGWISARQRDRLFDLAAQCPTEQAIVEIGSWKGKSTVILGWGSKSGNRAPVWAIDPHEGTPLFWCMHTGGDVKNTAVQFLTNIDAAGVKDIVYPLIETGHSAAQAFSDPIGLLFVDGDHKYAAFDVRDWFPLIVAGGWLALHDSNTPAVSSTVARLEAAGLVSDLETIDSMMVMRKV